LLDTRVSPPDQARRLIPRSCITRALGIEADNTIDLHTLAVRERGLYLLCTDGLTNMLSDDEIADFFYKINKEPLVELITALIDNANAYGSHDHISIWLKTLKDIGMPRGA